MDDLDDELTRVMVYAREQGLRKALAWIAKRQAERQRAATPKRKRKYHLMTQSGRTLSGQFGEVYIDPERFDDDGMEYVRAGDCCARVVNEDGEEVER